jgi:hypothetical protein
MVPLCTRYANVTRDTDRKNSEGRLDVNVCAARLPLSHAKRPPRHTCHKSFTSGIRFSGPTAGNSTKSSAPPPCSGSVLLSTHSWKGVVGHDCWSKREVNHCLLLSRNLELYLLSSKPRSETLDCSLHECWCGEFFRRSSRSFFHPPQLARRSATQGVHTHGQSLHRFICPSLYCLVMVSFQSLRLRIFVSSQTWQCPVAQRVYQADPSRSAKEVFTIVTSKGDRNRPYRTRRGLPLRLHGHT